MMDPKYIRIDAIHVMRTYAGCLEGLPKPEEEIASSRKRAKELWGKRATMLVPPMITNGRCPEWTIFAWLSAPAMNPGDYDGSELVVIWWQSEIDHDIPEALLHDLGCGSWEQYATDYQV